MTMPTTEQYRAADDAEATHEEQRLAAVERYVDALLAEVRAEILQHPERVPYVERSLYGSDGPELWLEQNADLTNPIEAFQRRVGRVQTITDAFMDEPEDQPTSPAHWDAIRLNNPGTQGAARALIVRIVRVAFACDQYSRAKYLWSDKAVGE